MGDWVSPRASLGSVKKKNDMPLMGIELQFLEHPTSRALKLIK
jgi:hypothetical protein